MSGMGENGVPLKGEADEEMSLEMFLAHWDPGRKKSLKSLEIPLDDLLSGIIFLSGGRDKDGGPVLSLTQPEDSSIDSLVDLSIEVLVDMLAYFTSVPSEESRVHGFTVILDGDVIHDFLMRKFIQALNIIQTEGGQSFKKVYFVSKTREAITLDWMSGEELVKLELPIHRVSNYEELNQFIDKSQLTAGFGGTLKYDHHDWVKFRMQVEPFLIDCVSVSKRLAKAIAPFNETKMPKSIKEAKESIHKHRLVRKDTIEQLHIDELASEGEKIDHHMHGKADSNPDFSNTLDTIKKLMEQIEMVKGRLENMWSARHEKLEANLKQHVFEKEASRVIEWFEEYAEEFFQTHTELGESLEIAETLSLEVNQFEESTQQILLHTDNLVKSGSELKHLPYTNQETVHHLIGKIQQLMTDFEVRLTKRKKKLNDSVQLHRLIATAIDWSVECASLLKEHDLKSSPLPTDSEAVAIKQEFDQFLADYPPPCQEDRNRLQELIDSREASFINETATFAYNRVVEVTEKFEHYMKVLNEILAEMKEKERRIHDTLTQNGEDYVDCGSSEAQLKDEDTREEVFSKPKVALEPLRLEDEEEEARKESQDGRADRAKSLEMDIFDALKMLEDAADKAERINSHSSEPEELVGSSDFRPRVGTNDSSSSRISKQDISFPTKTAGPLFVAEQDETFPSEGLSPYEQRRKISLLPCPDESFSEQAKHAKHRRKLMEELIETEEAYIRNLQKVVDEYMPAMDNLDEIPRNLIGKKNLIFSTLPHLLEFNRLVILPELESCRKCPIKLGQVFLTFEEDLLNYSMYFKNLPQQTALMQEGGVQFFAAVSQKLGDPFMLNSYLIKPFQRMTKYKQFLEDMLKYSAKSDLKGKLKDYYDRLKEAAKMADFILRHGNDLLALECLRGFEGSIKEQGKILRQGDLTLVQTTKHRRRVFLFEQTIILTKKKKPKSQSYEIAGSEVFDFKASFKTSNYGLRENVDGHPTRFELWRKKEVLTFQADTEEQKNMWVQDIWDLFFSHMLSLKDQNLDTFGSRPLTSLVSVGNGRSATIGRSFGHNVRRAMSMRHSGGRISHEYPTSRSRPLSITSNVSQTSVSSTPPSDELINMIRPAGNRPYSPSTTGANRLSGTFVDLRSRSPSRLSVTSDIEQDSQSKRSSIVSTSSASTVTSLNPSPTPPSEPLHFYRVESPSPQNRQNERRTSQLIMEVHRANGGGGTSPLPPALSTEEGEEEDISGSVEILSENHPPELERQKTIPIFDTPV